MQNKYRVLPSLRVSLIPVVSLIILLGYSIFGLGLDLETGGSHIPLLLGTAVAAIVSFHQGNSWTNVQKSLINGIVIAMGPLLILIVIGCLIGTWIQSGIVPSMIYYGLSMISPSYFLLTSCMICCIVSLSTGSSWSTAGTVGVALIGIGTALKIPAGMVAGSVISGAYFGDKMSPLSDTTNLAPAVSGTDIITHIRHMVYTVTPSLVIALVLYYFIGLTYGGNSNDTEDIAIMLSSLQGGFNISPWLLFPVVLVILMVVYKIPALPAMFGGAVLGGLVSVIFQGVPVADVIRVSFIGYEASTGVEHIDSLLSRGGLMSMMSTVALILAALSFGGVMEGSGMLETIALTILKSARSVGSLVLATSGTCICMNIIAPDQYLAIVVPGRMYKKAFDMHGLHPKNLSRVLEDTGTLSSPLVAWNTCGAFMGGVLGVSPFVYAPFAFLNLINPILSVTYGYTGFSMHKENPEDQSTDNALE
jgi:NhaC family Na+:H+ antiporter